MAPHCSPRSNPNNHIVLFPFLSKGHTIPLLHLAQLLLGRGAALTIFTTAANHLFISQHLPRQNVSIVDLPFPDHIQGVPPGIESTDKLPSMSLFPSFAAGVKLMQPAFERELEKISSDVSCIVSDGFLPWTLDSASRFGIPRLSYSGMSHYASAVSRDAGVHGLLPLHVSDDERFNLVYFPWIRLARNDFDDPFNKRDPRGPYFDFIMEICSAIENSHGLIVNSFYELEKIYADYCNRHSRAKLWSVGPLCLSKLEKEKTVKQEWMHWLDEKSTQNSPVLFIAFGSQARISATQLREIALGLEESKVSFLCVVKKSEREVINEEYEEKVKERGMVVSEWVEQEEILQHETVKGFVSHCGWNSVLEGICAGVPIVAWPMMADQFLNAKMVVEEMKVGVRVSTVDGKSKGFVAAESLKRAVREVMEAEGLRRKAAEIAVAARLAVGDGVSSWNDLNNLITHMQREKEIRNTKS